MEENRRYKVEAFCANYENIFYEKNLYLFFLLYSVHLRFVIEARFKKKIRKKKHLPTLDLNTSKQLHSRNALVLNS